MRRVALFSSWPQRLVPLALVSLLVLPAQSAFAQPSVSSAASAPSPADAAEAKRRFTVGLKLYNERAFVEALIEFEASYRLGGRPSALRNIAQCHRDLRHFADAYEAYARLLDLHGAQLSPAERVTVRLARDELAELSASLVVTSPEAGATVELDGSPLGKTPLKGPVRVSLASHHLVVTKAGFEPFTKDLTVPSNGAATVVALLVTEITTGHLDVREMNGDPVHIFVDGKDEGPAPWQGDVAPGEHTLEAKGATFAAAPRQVAVAKRERLALVLDATTTQGKVRLTTVPASARLTFDGRPVGTGVWEGDVAPGPHHVEARGDAGAVAVREVTVTRGQLLVEEISLAIPTLVADYRGIYVRIAIDGVYSPTSTSPWAGPEVGDPTFHFGFGGSLHVGYSFDVLALELVGAFGADHYQAPLHLSTPISAQVTGIDTFLGVGGRATSHGTGMRGTVGLAPGVAIHVINLNDGSANASSNCRGALTPCPMGSSPSYTTSAGYVAPGFLFDGGLILGTGTGARFYLGLQAWLDFAPTVHVGPDPSATEGILPASAFEKGSTLKLVTGPQLYVGPTLGVQFGR